MATLLVESIFYSSLCNAIRRSCPRRPCRTSIAFPSSTSEASQSHRRTLQTTSFPPQNNTPDFAFAFDIDGVLLRQSSPLPRAHKTLSYLQKNNIPFILLTNGGGKHESERVAELSGKLGVELSTDLFVQSHTPFQSLVGGDGEKEGLRDKCVLVMGGEGDRCRGVAERYGFRNIITPADLLTDSPSIWPFAADLLPHYASFAHPLPLPICTTASPSDTSKPTLKIDAIFVYTDPRDWALDTSILLDILLSSQGYIGTLSPQNNNPKLPNRGYQQDNQPKLYYSNPDLWWAAGYHLPRLGQGGFRESFEGVWKAATGGANLEKEILGKPTQGTFEFAEERMVRQRRKIAGGKGGLRNVYMIGDNPESDIRGANEYKSPFGSRWYSVLVRSGVFNGGEPAHTPKVVVDDVWDAVRWGLEREGWAN
ncbi:MAG: hypothetical protein M1812_005446 [Candelaria pacifica]|nr:MAG: hypothetical protein M1812_005446 [Candelaria pacifica]